MKLSDNAFAKLFCHDGSQILVKRDETEDGRPVVEFFFRPVGVGLTKLSVSFDDSDSGNSAADEAFAVIDDEKAIAFVRAGWAQFEFQSNDEEERSGD